MAEPLAGVEAALIGAPLKVAYADSSSTTPPPPPPTPAKVEPPPKPRNDHPRTTSAGFDPEALERCVKALRNIEKSPYAKKVFELMKELEKTRQMEQTAKVQEYKQMQAQFEMGRP